MITAEDIRKQAERAYPEYLRSLVSGMSFFPLEIRFGKRTPKGNYKTFAEKRDALLGRAARVLDHAPDADSTGNGSPTGDGMGFVVELGAHNSRRFGRQLLPARIYFENDDGYTGFLGKTSEAQRLRRIVATTRRSLPELMPWLERHAPRVTGSINEWDDLLATCRYFLEHPRPNRYARELPLPVHTKFIEENEGILRLMLNFLLPAEAIEADVFDFARRFGLRYDEPLVRLRALDSKIPHTSGWPSDDVSLPVSALEALSFEGCPVVISENKMTFLTLPPLENGLALWGGGFKLDVLRNAEWLRACDVYYWGDLDAHGFMMLSRLRSFLPQAASVMMDVETFETFRAFAVSGTPSETTALPNLTPSEQAVFQSLARNNLRLEQERISHDYVKERLGYRHHSGSALTMMFL